MKESFLYKKLEEDKVQCKTCAHYCVIKLGERGVCGVRENRKGTLFVLNYGKAVSLGLDPIEKKPLFHFLPGTSTLSFATEGCNFRCSNCQNWRISQGPRMSGRRIRGEGISPEEIVKIAVERSIPSISYTYTEPTIFLEYALDVMKRAKKEGIKNVWVTNGFLSKEALDLIAPYLDAASTDLKSFSDDFYREICGGRLKPVLSTLKRMKEKDIWLEVTTLVIPTLSDGEENLRNIAEFVATELGKDVPWHVTRFSGAISWKMKDLPDTSVSSIKKARRIGKEAGLNYVYTGNIPGLSSENTFCAHCGELVLERSGFLVKRKDEKGRCPACGEKINLVLKDD